MTSIRIEGIEKSFGSMRALKGVTLKVEPGELFTLLGPSGCGKTTLLRTVAGFYRQNAGDIFLGDELVNDMPAYKRETGMVFQNYAVFPHMTVFENVAYGLRVRKMRGPEVSAKVEAALKSVRLSGYGDRTPDQLSGGQQQRVGLARAMVIEPRVLLLDEPLSNLDAKLRVEMRSEIRDIQKAMGITALYVTHDQEEALAISDRIAVIAEGVVQQVGTPWIIYKAPINLFVATFVGTMNLLEGEIVAIDGDKRVKIRVKGGEFLVAAPSEGSVIGRRVTVGFRPEAPRFNPQAGAENMIEATVCAHTFLGSTATIGLEVGETPIIVEYHRPESLDELRAGSAAKITLDPSSILLFDPETKTRIAMVGEDV
ncbi:MAG TPA: ABC transporter ATP-binding protein [Rectinemataceae bacterium]|nr:ABC transporter ATP-binding protein [Rectinemataceae bacterium]